MKSKRIPRGIPCISIGIIVVIIALCLCAGFITKVDPSYLDLYNAGKAPCKEFFFGTDTLGRDMFSGILYGGRISILIGILSTLIALIIAIVYGSLSAMAPEFIDTILMRFTEIILSVPGLLLVVFIQGILGKANVISLSVVIGITSWMSMAKVIRTEVRQIRNSDYVVASRVMGGGFFHILRKHLAPNFAASIMFMAVMGIRGAIVSESTLSFMGMGLPIEMISWGSMLSLADKALLTGSWWMIFIPGIFLVVLLLCITNVGNYLRARLNAGDSYLSVDC